MKTELVGMLMNQLSASMDFTKTTSTNSSGNFSQIFANTNNSTNSNTYSSSSYSSNSNSDSSKTKADSSKSSIYDSSNKSNSSSNNNKTGNSVNEKPKSTTTNNNSESEKFVAIVDEEKLTEVADTLGVSEEQVLQALSELSMSLSMLAEPENLVKFVSEVFEITDPSQLLSIDNMKNMMSDITDIAESIDYMDYVPFGEGFADILSNLQDNGVENFKLLTSNANEIPQDIQSLLKELNGEIVSVKVGKEVVDTGVDEVVDEMPETTTDVIQSFTGEEGMQDLSQNSQQQNNNQEQSTDSSLTAGSLEESGSSSKVYNASLPKTQSYKNINSTEIIAQIMEKMQGAIKNNVSELTMTLNPASLGEIAVKLASQSGIVTAQFLADNEKIKEIIEQNMEQLKELLAEQGIEVGEIEVGLSGEGKQFTESGDEFTSNQNFLKDNEELEEEVEKEIIAQDNLGSSVNYSA